MRKRQAHPFEQQCGAMSEISRLNFQHLLYLQALVEEQHVTRAAERMGIGQPAMSAALAKLRLVFKDELLVKTTSGMEPTIRAMELLRRIREMSDLLEGRGFADELFDPATSRAHWRIMASDGIARVVLPELMELAGTAAPHVRFTVHPGDPRRVSEYLRDGDFDLALSFVRAPPRELRQVALYPQEPVCIARKGHPEVRGTLTLKQFVAQHHVRWGAPPVAHATMEAMVDEALEALGHSRRVRLLVASLTLLPGIVARTDMLAVVSEQLALSLQESIPIQTLTLPFKVPSVDVSMLWHERLHHDPGHKWLRTAVRDIGRRLGAASAG